MHRWWLEYSDGELKSYKRQSRDGALVEELYAYDARGRVVRTELRRDGEPSIAYEATYDLDGAVAKVESGGEVDYRRRSVSDNALRSAWRDRIAEAMGRAVSQARDSLWCAVVCPEGDVDPMVRLVSEREHESWLGQSQNQRAVEALWNPAVHDDSWMTYEDYDDPAPAELRQLAKAAVATFGADADDQVIRLLRQSAKSIQKGAEARHGPAFFVVVYEHAEDLEDAVRTAIGGRRADGLAKTGHFASSGPESTSGLLARFE